MRDMWADIKVVASDRQKNKFLQFVVDYMRDLMI